MVTPVTITESATNTAKPLFAHLDIETLENTTMKIALPAIHATAEIYKNGFCDLTIELLFDSEEHKCLYCTKYPSSDPIAADLFKYLGTYVQDNLKSYSPLKDAIEYSPQVLKNREKAVVLYCKQEQERLDTLLTMLKSFTL
jgi:hypothetical protein